MTDEIVTNTWKNMVLDPNGKQTHVTYAWLVRRMSACRGG